MSENVKKLAQSKKKKKIISSLNIKTETPKSIKQPEKNN